MDITNTIGYYLRPNPTDTAEKAPYLPKLVPNGVANLNDVARKIAESLSVSEERAKLIIRETFTESVAEALLGYTVDMGALRMKARIPGSMPCEDTPFDPEANACVIDLYADDELSGAFDALKPVKLTETQLANAIKVSNVMDVETERFSEIHGTGEFMILGNSVTLDAPGESAKLADRKTGAELVAAEVVSVSKGQRATCRLNPTAGGIAAGPYWFVVTTFGLIGETTPRVFRKPVMLTEAIPAPPEPIDETSDGKVAVYAATDGGQSETFTYGHTWTLDGKGFCVGPELSGWAIGSVIVHTPDSNSYMLDLDWTPSADGRTLTLKKSDSAMPISAGEYPGSKIKVNLIYDPQGAATEETLEIPIDFVVED